MQTAGTERPRLRQDLLAEAIEERGDKLIDVIDPDSGHVFRFYEVEFSLACAMDGERDVDGLISWAQEELGLRTTPSEVISVIETLGQLGYLDLSDPGREAAALTAASPDRAADVTPLPIPDRRTASGDSAIGSPDDAAEDRAEAQLGLRERPDASAPPPEAPEIELGPPGGARATAPDEQEMSLDLADHMAVRAADVQEAVRQSKVMAAVELPPELREPDPRPARAPTPLAEPLAPPPVPASAPVAMPRVPDRSAVAPADKPPVALPEPAPRPQAAPSAEKQPVAPPAPARRVSPLLIALLIVGIAGAAGFLVWRLLLTQSGDPGAPAHPPPPIGSAAPAAGATGSAETALGSAVESAADTSQRLSGTIEMLAGRPKTILAFFPGTIEWIEASGKEVKSNDVIMRLVGSRPIEAQVAALAKELEQRTADLIAARKVGEAAAATGDAAAQARAEAKVAQAERAMNLKSEQLRKKRDQLETFLVRLIVDGTLTVMNKVGDKIPENARIAVVQPPPAPSVKFAVPDGFRVDPGSAIGIYKGKEVLTCVVTDSEPGLVLVTCPPGPGVEVGVKVEWALE